LETIVAPPSSLGLRKGVASFRVSANFDELKELGMALSVNTRKVQGVVVVDMSGKLAAGEGALLLRDTVRRFSEDGSKKFLLNLGAVSYIDSAGLGELIATYTSLRNKGGDVKLLNLTKSAKDLLQMTKLLTVFDTYDDEGKAIQALS
jgi:anti-sigma B factor antagonist